MNRKIVSIAMAMILAVSSMTLGASADEIGDDTAQVKTGTIKFDSGDWNSERVLFYIWDDTTGQQATRNGWTSDNPWGSKKKIGGTAVEDEDGVFESYEFSMSDDHDYFVIFHDPDNGQTYDCALDSSAFGLTAYMTGNLLENPIDSEKTAIEAVFPNGLGPALTITSSGKIQGSYISPNTDRADKVAQFVLSYLGMVDYVSGEEVVTEENVAEAIEVFGTTADDVWAAYLNHAGESNFNPEDAKLYIKPTIDIPFDTPDVPEPYPYYPGDEMVEIGSYGDMDGDGEITSLDSIIILRVSVGLELLSREQEICADVDGDGSINATDSLFVLRASVGYNDENAFVGETAYNYFYNYIDDPWDIDKDFYYSPVDSEDWGDGYDDDEPYVVDVDRPGLDEDGYTDVDTDFWYDDEVLICD